MIGTIRRHPWLTRLALIVVAMLVAILAGAPVGGVLLLAVLLVLLAVGAG